MEHPYTFGGPFIHGLQDALTADAIRDGLVVAEGYEYYHSAANGFADVLYPGEGHTGPPISGQTVWELLERGALTATPAADSLSLPLHTATSSVGEFCRWFSPSMGARLSLLGFRARTFAVAAADILFGTGDEVMFRRWKYSPVRDEDPVAAHVRMCGGASVH